MRTPVRIAIRAAVPSDVDEIASLHLASWLAAYRGIVPDEFLAAITLESRVIRWRKALSSSESPLTETILAVDGSTIQGVSSFGPRRHPASTGVGEVYALHVAPASRRRGIGRLLLDDSIRRLAIRGFSGAVLWVLRDNVDARHFYEAQGWSVTGEEIVEERDGHAIPETRYAIAFAQEGAHRGHDPSVATAVVSPDQTAPDRSTGAEIHVLGGEDVGDRAHQA
jgi:ribosomal protein S18 acetylase RimI-like enzyme